MAGIHHVDRESVRQVACPSCKAEPGQNCIGARDKVRESNHQTRVRVYVGQSRARQRRERSAGNLSEAVSKTSSPRTVVIPSPDEVEAAKTPAGSWTKKQLAEWGVPWPPPKGWKQDLVQKWIWEDRKIDQMDFEQRLPKLPEVPPSQKREVEKAERKRNRKNSRSLRRARKRKDIKKFPWET